MMYMLTKFLPQKPETQESRLISYDPSVKDIFSASEYANKFTARSHLVHDCLEVMVTSLLIGQLSVLNHGISQAVESCP